MADLVADPAIEHAFHAGSFFGASLDLSFQNTAARYVRVQSSGLSRMVLAEVEILQAANGMNQPQEEGGVHFFVNDHLMTPQMAVNRDNVVTWQAEYTSFGNTDISVEQFVNNHRFPGQYYDSETGLHYNCHRYYDPETGRYVTSGPIGLGGGLNTFGYVLGNPLKYSDRHGLVVTGEWDVTSPGGGVWASYEGMFSSIDSGVYRNDEVYDVNRTVWGYGVIVGQVKCTDTECGEEETWTVGPIVLEDSVTALIESGVPEEFYHFTEWKHEWKATDVVQSEIAKWKNYNPTAFCFKK